MVAPLLATKLHLPAPRATAVPRARLVERILAGLRGRLTLIAAPAGFGKSTLLVQALARVEQTIREEHFPALPSTLYALRSAWVALDVGDNDPTRFWSYVCMALERASSGVGAPALALLRVAPTEIEPVLAELLNALAIHGGHIALVLDDYHTISNPAIHEGMAFLLDYAPPQFHLVLASRIDPPLPLARWRARGDLVEIRAADLRFTSDEAGQFFAETMGMTLDAESVTALEARTEGWAAGLQLAALSLQGQADVADFIASFSGSHRHVVDYLAEEVLSRQPDHIRAFLIQTSILERLCGSLCDAVLAMTTDLGPPTTGENDLSVVRRPSPVARDSYSQIILNDIERMNLFLIPLDNERRWYRYHHLFADLLRHRLRQEHPALVAELHRRAARWFERHSAVAEALNHALAAGDTTMAARMLTTHGPRFAATGETTNLQRWLDALPREQVLCNPQLCLTQAQVLMLNRQVAVAEPYLQAAEAGLAGDAGSDTMRVRGELLTLRAHIALERGRFNETLALAQEAMAMLPPTAYLARSNTGLVLGYALMVLGRTSEAVTVYSENVPLCRAAGNIINGIFSANEIVKLRALQGRLHEAYARVEHALAWVAEEGWQHFPPTSALHIWRGHVLLEQGEFGAAEVEFARAIQLSQHGVTITMARAHVFLARLRQIQGDRAGANAALTVVEAIVSDWEPGGERAFFTAYVARVRVLQGDVEAARRWADERAPWNPNEPPSYFREIELLTRARIAVLDEAGSSNTAHLVEPIAMLGWLREHAIAGGRGAVVIETLALEALALARCGQGAQAHDQLDVALTQAAPEGFIGTFVDLGAPMAELLAQNRAQRTAHDPLRPYLTRLLHTFAGSQAEQALPTMTESLTQRAVTTTAQEVEVFTARELEVLRLFAAGMTSPEIAQHFVVSINTVKTQLKSIYSKLGAHSRAEAVARARDLGIIPA
jgi:LuxR family maltose regulon positive regulatory protein